MQGRPTEPVHKPRGEDHYRPSSWDEAISVVAKKLQGLDGPDEAAFCTSGRASNETAFLYQLFVRGLGTNELPDCSDMCHESTGWGMGRTIGVGKSTVTYDDHVNSDLRILIGQNPGTNHPRMFTALEKQKENGGRIVAVRRMRDGEITFFMALGGNVVAAMSDTTATEAAMDQLEMNVQISTKLNRSHTVTGAEALILPTLGRTEIDRQAAGVQFIPVEDTMSAVHPSWGKVEPVGEHLLSEVAIVARLARATLGNEVDADREGFEADPT